jgi:hypothetical protein
MRFNEFKIKEDIDRFMGAILGSNPFSSVSNVVDKISGKTDPAKPNAKQGTANANIQDPDFNKKLHKIAQALGISYDTLYKIIKFETAGSFSPSSKDPNNVSVGLIGFTERTARGLGTSKAELAKMTAVQQLDYVYQFYKNAGVQPGEDIGTIYMRTFMPAFVNASDSTVLGKKGGGDLILPSGKSSGLSLHKVWEQNPAFAKSKGRNYFTVGDVKSSIRNR